MATMELDPSYKLGLREGVTTIHERLDGSFKGKLYDSLSRATPISGDYDKQTNLPIRTVINRSWMRPDRLEPVPQAEFNARILNYQKSGFTSAAHDDMVAGRHYVQGKYEATVTKPEVFIEHAWFNTLQDLQNSFSLKSDKYEKMAINILTAKNVSWLKALTAKEVLRATRNDESDLSTMLVPLPESRYFEARCTEAKDTIDFREIATLNAKTKTMNGYRKILAMSPMAHVAFYDFHKKWLKNNDYSPGSDISQLDTIKPFEGGITPFVLEDISAEDGQLLFGLDESIMVLFNPLAVSKCVWGGLEADFAVDGDAYNQVKTWRKETLSYVRTSDGGVLIIKIPPLIPTLDVQNASGASISTLSVTASATVATAKIATNDSRMTPQAWRIVSGESWIKPAAVSGTGTTEIKIGFDANTTSSARTGTIEIYSDVPGYEGDVLLKKTLSVTQSA